MSTSDCVDAPCARDSNGKSPLRWLYAATRRLRLWRRRARDRRELLRLDTRLLRDIGVTADEARCEATKPFWRD